MNFELIDVIISAVIFSGMGQGKDSGKLLFRKIFSDGSITITEDDTSMTFSSSGGNGGAILQDRVAIGTGTGITHSFICVNDVSPFYGSLTGVRSIRGNYDPTRASYNTGFHSFIIGGSTNSISGGYSYYSTIIGGQTNSIINGGNDLIVGGTLNQVYGFKQSSANKIFGGSENQIQFTQTEGQIFGGRLNKLCEDNTDSSRFNQILGGEQNEISCANFGSLIIGGTKNCMISTRQGVFLATDCSWRNTILSSCESTIDVSGSNYLPNLPIPSFTQCISYHNNIIGSIKSQISSQFSSFERAPKYNNIIGGNKNNSGGWYSNILSGANNSIIGNWDNEDLTNSSFMQIISSNNSKNRGHYYGNIISSYGSYMCGSPKKFYSTSIISSRNSYSRGGANIFSSFFTRGLGSFILSSVGGQLLDNTVISSGFPGFNAPDTRTASNELIISSDLNFFGENFGVNGFFNVQYSQGGTPNNNIYPTKGSLILSSCLVLNYNTFGSKAVLQGDSTTTMIISSNKILSGYNLTGFAPITRPDGTIVDVAIQPKNVYEDVTSLIDTTLMISNCYSCQRTNCRGLMISTIDSRMSNGINDSIIGGNFNNIKNFGPGFYEKANFNHCGDFDGRILRAINGGEVAGIDLGRSKSNMILGGFSNGFYSVGGEKLQIGTAGPGLLNSFIAGQTVPVRSLNTRYSSIIGGSCNKIIADISTASSVTCAICNPIIHSVILGSCCKEMRVCRQVGLDNLIISGTPWGGSVTAGNNGISGTFNSPITQICVCRGFVTCVVTSDKRLKIIIQKIAVSNSGLNIYLFKYVEKPEIIYQGVIAQELLDTRFENAVSINENGFYQVDYSKIDVEFKQAELV